MRRRLGSEPAVIDVGGYTFTSNAFTPTGTAFERVYTCVLDDEEIVLAESDVLCMRDAGHALQRSVVHNLKSRQRTESIARILQAEGIVLDASTTIAPRAVATRGEDVMNNLNKLNEEMRIGADEIIIRRARLNAQMYMLVTRDQTCSHSIFSFRSLATWNAYMENDLVAFRSGGDIDATVRKVLLMMESEQFGRLDEDGLWSAAHATSRSNTTWGGALRLEGSEFWLCCRCHCVYSLVNGRVAVVWSRVEDDRCAMGQSSCVWQIWSLLLFSGVSLLKFLILECTV